MGKKLTLPSKVSKTSEPSLNTQTSLSSSIHALPSRHVSILRGLPLKLPSELHSQKRVFKIYFTIHFKDSRQKFGYTNLVLNQAKQDLP